MVLGKHLGSLFYSFVKVISMRAKFQSRKNLERHSSLLFLLPSRLPLSSYSLSETPVEQSKVIGKVLRFWARDFVKINSENGINLTKKFRRKWRTVWEKTCTTNEWTCWTDL